MVYNLFVIIKKESAMDFETYEYVIVPRPTAKNKLLKALLIVCYVLFVIAWFIFGALTGFYALLALIPVTLWMLVFATWRYSNVEYEYSVLSGRITFSKIYGGRSRKKVLELDLRSAEAILPLNEKQSERLIDDFDPQSEISFISHSESPDAYAVLFREDDTKCAVYMEINARMMKTCKLYNSHALKRNS